MFCGYEGRSGLPSNFDCQYSFALGIVSALLIHAGATGYMSCIKNLTLPVNEWEAAGVPIFDMLHLEERQGGQKSVIRKTLVDLERGVFQVYAKKRVFFFFQAEDGIRDEPLTHCDCDRKRGNTF